MKDCRQEGLADHLNVNECGASMWQRFLVAVCNTWGKQLLKKYMKKTLYSSVPHFIIIKLYDIIINEMNIKNKVFQVVFLQLRCQVPELRGKSKKNL